jgi:hypothetical protein
MQSTPIIVALSGIVLSGLSPPVYAQGSRTASAMEMSREPIKEGKGMLAKKH